MKPLNGVKNCETSEDQSNRQSYCRFSIQDQYEHIRIQTMVVNPIV